MTSDEVQRGAGSGGRLVASMSINMVAAVATAIAGVLATGFMARAMPIDRFGSVLLLLTLVTAFAVFEGQRPVVIQRVAAGQFPVPALFRESARINAVIAAGVAALFILVAVVFPAAGIGQLELAILVATIACFFGSSQYAMFLDAEQDTSFTGLARSACWIGLYVSLAILAALGAAIAAFGAAMLAMYLVLWAVLVMRYRTIRRAELNDAPSPQLSTGLLAPALSNVLFNACAVTISLADRAIVSAAMGAGAAGRYAGPSELALRGLGLVRAAVQVVLPWAARLPGQAQDTAWARATLVIAFVAGGVASIAILARDALVVLLLGEKFRLDGDLLGIFIAGAALSTLGYVAIVRLNARGNFSSQRNAYAVGAAILLIGAPLAAQTGNLVAVGTAFLLARSVDLWLLVENLRSCGGMPRALFLILLTTLALATGAAFADWPVATAVALSGAGVLALLVQRRLQESAPWS